MKIKLSKSPNQRIYNYSLSIYMNNALKKKKAMMIVVTNAKLQLFIIGTLC